MKYLIASILLIVSYLIGSIPVGYLIGKAKGINLLKEGSGNIGATNVGRLLGFKYSAIVFLLDMLKGFLIVFILKLEPINSYILVSPMLYGFITVLGSAYSIFLKFKGGKCVSVGSGAIAGYCPMLLPVMLISFFIFRFITHIVSLSSIITGIIALISVVLISVITNEFLDIQNISSYNLFFVIFSALILFLLLFRHRENIIRIIHKEEKPINY